MSNDKYIHSDVEDKIYSYWEKNNLFKPIPNKKKFWLLPIIFVLTYFAALIILSQGSAIAPFIYTIF